MKKIIKTLVLLFIFLLPTAVLFAGCGGSDIDDGEMMSLVVTSKSSAMRINDYNEINLEHGQVYIIDINSFKYYAGYQKGKKEINDTSKITFSTSFPSGEVAPLGNYELYISYGNYSNYYTIKINKVVAKPVASQTSFIYSGEEQIPEITGIQDEYMYEMGYSVGADVSCDYFKQFFLRENCMWSDGSTEPYYLGWEILPYEIPTPTYTTITYNPYDSWSYPGEHLENVSDYEDIPNFSLEIYDNIIHFGESLNSVGAHTVYCEILSPNYCFAGGERRVAGEFKINVLYIEIPEFIKEYTYSNGGHNVQFVDGWPSHVTTIGDVYQTELGTHYTLFEVSDPGNVLWEDIEDFEVGEQIVENVIKVSDSQIKIVWEIVPIKIKRPTLIQKEIVFDHSSHSPLLYESNEGMEFNYNDKGFGFGNDTQYDAGEYRVEVRLNYGYVWSDTETSENLIFDWKIIKANLVAPGEGQTGFDEWRVPGVVSAKNTFDVSKIYLPFGFDFSTFSSTAELEAAIGESVSFIDNKFTDSNGIIWVRDISDGIKISQTFDLSGKSVGDTQAAYATYYSTSNNYFDKKDIIFNIDIAEKGSQWIDFIWDDPNAPDVDWIYGDVFMFDEENLFVRSGDGYKLQYKFINTDNSGENFTYYHNSTDTWVNVGEYTVYLELEESSDYKYYSKFVSYNVNVGKKILTAENVAGVSAGKIYRLDELKDSLFDGQVMHNGKTVEGTFNWTNPFFKPSLNDSNVTEFEYTFTPTNTDNYSQYKSTTKITIERSVVRAEIFPTLGRVANGYGKDFFFEGDNWADIIINSLNARARDKNNYIIDGTWSLIIPEGKTVVDDEFALKFSPENQTYYQDCIFYNLYGQLDSYYKIKDVCYKGAEPEFVVNYDGKLYYHIQYAAVTYTNHVAEFNFEYDIENFTINEIDGGYTLTFLGHTSSATYNYSNFVEVTTEYDLLNYVLYHYDVSLDTSTILIVNGDIVVNDAILGSDRYCLDIFRMFIPEGSSLSFESTVYLQKDNDLIGENIFAENAVIHNLAHTFYNFGTLKFYDVYGNMELINYNTTTIDRYCLDYLSMYNAKDGVVNVNLCENIQYRTEYRSFGSFENHGTFNYIYHIETPDSELKDSVNENELFRFRIEKKSINTGTLNGLFEIAEADFFLNSGTQISPFVNIYYKNSSGDKTYKYVRSIVRDETIAESDMGKFEIRAETVADLVLAFKMNYDLERSERVIIKVMNDIDISDQEEWFYDFNVSGSKHMATLLVRENCQLIILEGATLTLGNFKLGLQYNNYQENKGKLINYGKIVGDIVCEANKYSTFTETYYQLDYVSGDGEFEGVIWKKDDYFAWKNSQE